MELRHLRYFVAVAGIGNLSRAASQLRVAQPALTRQVRDLERELGVALLERHSKGVTPTLAGEAFARGAMRVLADAAAALERAEATAEGVRGRVVIGAMRAVIVHGFAPQLEDALRGGASGDRRDPTGARLPGPDRRPGWTEARTRSSG